MGLTRLLEQLDLQVDHLPFYQQQQLRELILSYEDATDIVTHTIDTGAHPPINQPMRRTPFALWSKVDELVQEMLSQGVIEPSKSPWCVHYRQLNCITKLDEYPLPRVDVTLDQLAGAKFFTTLDLASGWPWMRLHVTRQLSQHTQVPMSLQRCHSATFQRLMENVLAGLVA